MRRAALTDLCGERSARSSLSRQ